MAQKPKHSLENHQNKNQFIKYFSTDNWILLLFLVAVSSLFWSKWLLGLSNLLLLLTALFDFILRQRPQQKWATFINRVKHPAYLSLIFIFISILISAAIHKEWDEHADKAMLSLPYIILPIAFALFNRIDKYFLSRFILGYIFIATLFALGVILNFIGSSEDIIEKIGQGQAMPTPESHIRFSMLISTAVLLSAITALSNIITYTLNTKRGIIILGIFLFVFQHILAVKTGILSTYVALSVYMLFESLKRKNYSLIGITVFIIMFSALTAYVAIPSFKAKIDYTVWDLNQFGDKDGRYLSDTYRLTSMLHGIDVFQSAPLFGVGYHQIESKVREIYKSTGHIEISIKLPHNNFIYILAAGGLLGALLSIPGFFLPFLSRPFKDNPYLLPIGCIFITSCMIEPTVETTLGVHYHLLFSLIFLKFKPISVE